MSAVAPPDELETAEARPPLERHLLIQADQFCTCGYNLHSQRVTYDERLDFPVVRCPECGKWHPAGHGSTALRPWLARLATVGLAIWIGVLLLIGAAIAGTLIGMQFGYMFLDVTHAYIDPATRRAIDQRIGDDGTWQWVYLDTGETADTTMIVRFEMVAVPIDDSAASSAFGRAEQAPWQVRVALISIVSVVGLLGGMIQAAAMWHVRGWRRFVPPMLVIGLAGGICWMVLSLNHDYYESVMTLARTSSLLILGTAAAGWLAGLFLGRPVFRSLVTGLVPPRPRLMLAFLWLADGKTPPTAQE